MSCYSFSAGNELTGLDTLPHTSVRSSHRMLRQECGWFRQEGPVGLLPVLLLATASGSLSGCHFVPEIAEDVFGVAQLGHLLCDWVKDLVCWEVGLVGAGGVPDKGEAVCGRRQKPSWFLRNIQDPQGRVKGFFPVKPPW